MISFCGNGSTSGSMKDMRLKFGKDYTLAKNTYKKRGYTFKGWNTEPDGSGTDAEGNIILYTNQAKNPIIIQKKEIGKTLIHYAQWEITNFKIKYELNGGTNHELNPTTYTIEDKIILREPTRAGYNFLGWYTDSQFSESKKITTIKKGTLGNLVLYAKWVASMVEEVEIPDEYLDVRDFGAVADDDIDDTNAIEYAINKYTNEIAITIIYTFVIKSLEVISITMCLFRFVKSYFWLICSYVIALCILFIFFITILFFNNATNI